MSEIKIDTSSRLYQTQPNKNLRQKPHTELFNNFGTDTASVSVCTTNNYKSPSAVVRQNRKIMNDNEKVLYAKIYHSLPVDSKEKFEKLLNKGILLKSNSNDGSSVLENLYKIFTSPRTKEVEAGNILKECINILYNPLIVTQITEDIPEEYLDGAVEYVYNSEEKIRQQRKEIAKHSEYMRQQIEESGEDKLNKEDELKRIREEIEHDSLDSCVAASMEFLLASKYPAEFIRLIEGLTSEAKVVKRTLDCTRANLTEDSFYIYKTDYEIKNDKAEVTLRADDGAYLLAQMQKTCQDEDERTTIDILVQSLIFQISTRNSYNSVLDKHNGLYDNNDGLCCEEEVFALKILTGKNVLNYDFTETKMTPEKINKVKNNISTALAKGKYVLLGYNAAENDGCTEGHEITILKEIRGKDGKEYYVCKDTAEEENNSKTKLYEKNYIFKRLISYSIIK